MCRGRRTCELIGSDPTSWDLNAPTPRPDWHAAALGEFAIAVALAADGAVDEAAQLCLSMRDGELSEFFIEHAQNAGRSRLAALQTPLRPASRADAPYSSRVEAPVYLRDGYVCRYCGSRVVAGSVLKAMASLLGPEVFRAGATNASRHGVMLAFRASVDHVEPRNLGGGDGAEKSCEQLLAVQLRKVTIHSDGTAVV